MNFLFLGSEEISNSTYVAVVLVKWILHSRLSARLDDGPLMRYGVTEDPAINVLCFEYEDPVPGHNYVVNLRCSVKSLEVYIVQSGIDLFVEESPMSKSSLRFASPTLDEVHE